MSEAAFQQQVLELAQLYQWRAAHFRPARTADGSWRTPVAADGAGFPDLVLVRGPELIFAELKAERGRTSTAQQVWLAMLTEVACAVAAAGRGDIHGTEVAVEVHLWRPSDFDEILARLSLPRLQAPLAA